MLATATSYVKTDGTLLFTTDATAPIYYFMSGATLGWTASGNDCENWTMASGTMTTGWGGSSANDFINSGSASSCNTMLRVLCVEQPPATPLATH